jgi:hypothetical protein
MPYDQFTVRRRVAHTNCIPAEQAVVEILWNGKPIQMMGSWSTLCLPEGAINALEATDEQLLRAYTSDESVFGK